MAPSYSRGREHREIAFTIAGSRQKLPPAALRTERGELDVEAIARAWLGWRRLECNGADMGGVHTVEAGYSRGAMFRPGAGRGRVELHDMSGRHVSPLERQYHAITKAAATLESAGLFW